MMREDPAHVIDVDSAEQFEQILEASGNIVSITKFDLLNTLDFDENHFPGVLKNQSYAGSPGFQLFHATKGFNVLAILRAKMLSRSRRTGATLDGKYGVCLTKFEKCLSDYTSKDTAYKAIFFPETKLHRRCSNFKGNKYCYAHESWLHLSSLFIVSNGHQVNDIGDFLTNDGVFAPGPSIPIEEADIPDNWLALPESFCQKYAYV